MKNSIPILLAIFLLNAETIGSQEEFPIKQPKNGNFNRPAPDEVLDVSPPGFCCWRISPRGEVKYRLRIENTSGNTIYQSELLGDPVHVPGQVLPAGTYSWSVDALDAKGKVISTRPAQKFSISEDARELPWIEPEILLSRVPTEHPRLLLLGENVKNPPSEKVALKYPHRGL